MLPNDQAFYVIATRLCHDVYYKSGILNYGTFSVVSKVQRDPIYTVLIIESFSFSSSHDEATNLLLQDQSYYNSVKYIIQNLTFHNLHYNFKLNIIFFTLIACLWNFQ